MRLGEKGENFLKAKISGYMVPCTPCICMIMQLGHMLSTTFTYTYKASRAYEQKAQHHA